MCIKQQLPVYCDVVCIFPGLSALILFAAERNKLKGFESGMCFVSQ